MLEDEDKATRKASMVGAVAGKVPPIVDILNK
jgi:translation initiation factor IF-2